MSNSKRTRPERTVAPGVRERHALDCAVGPRRPCTCTPSYRARVYTGPRGAQKAYSATFATRADAVAWVGSMRRNLDAGALPPVRERSIPVFADAAVRFLERALIGDALTRSRRRYATATIENYEIMLRRHVLPYIEPRTGIELGHLTVDSIDGRALQGLADTLQQRSREVARHATAAATAVLRDTYALGERDELPARIIMPPPGAARDYALELAEADAVLAAAIADDERLGRSLIGPLIGLLIGAGLRIGEASALTWGDGVAIDDDRVTIRVRAETTKTGAGVRTVRLEPEFSRLIRDHWEATGKPPNGAPVFTTPGGGPLARDGVVRAAFRRVRVAAGVEKLSPHVLRHSHATWAAAAGVKAPELAARMGHTDPAFTARRYVHALESEREAEVLKLSEYRARGRAANGS